MRLALVLPASGLVALVACGGTAVEPSGGGGSTGATTSASGTGGGSGGGSSTTSGTGGSAAPAEPDEKFIPKPTGTCPEFVTGKASVTFKGKSRDIEIWATDAAKTLDGPLVFFWHGAGGSPKEASYALGKAVAAINALGGVVVAPYHDPAAGQLPWYLCLGGDVEDDLLVADEVLGCAIEKVGIDKRHIHSVGFSAGAMNTEQFAARRSGYLASIVAYSGARLGVPPVQDESNKYPAMLFYGGPSDQVIINFATATKSYYDDLTMEGHFAFTCNHNKGHTVPTDGRDAAWQFLQDHPFGVSPEPYEKGLPMGFPSYCTLGEPK
ncbi:MAG: hypothetical protein U0359_40680 [Byssovorax sp.]